MFYPKLYAVGVGVLALVLGVEAFWRLPCRDRVGLERIDPLVNPGEISAHVHTIMGPNTFHANATCEDLQAGTCSSCQVKQDKSAYWTPALYFQHADGKFEIVPQTGGMLVYYLQRGENVTAFPPGFMMLAGDPLLRDFPYRNIDKSHWTDQDRTEDALRQKAVGFNCLNYAEPAHATLGLRRMPDNIFECKDGLRGEIFFPSCWDGKRLDSPDHKDHMRYPSLMDDGECPPSHPVRLVSLLFETIWYVDQFAGMPGNFVWSTGDPTGFGYHGDFINGWDQTTLEQAVAQCRSLSGIVDECPFFDFYTVEEMRSCKLEYSDLDEDVIGPLEQLPGCNPVQYGPMRATKHTCDSPNKIHELQSHSSASVSLPEIQAPKTAKSSIIANSYPTHSSLSSSSITTTPTSTTPTPTKAPVLTGHTPSHVHVVVVTITQTAYVDIYVDATPTPTPTMEKYTIKKRVHGHHRRHAHQMYAS